MSTHPSLNVLKPLKTEDILQIDKEIIEQTQIKEQKEKEIQEKENRLAELKKINESLDVEDKLLQRMIDEETLKLLQKLNQRYR